MGFGDPNRGSKSKIEVEDESQGRTGRQKQIGFAGAIAASSLSYSGRTNGIRHSELLVLREAISPSNMLSKMYSRLTAEVHPVMHNLGSDLQHTDRQQILDDPLRARVRRSSRDMIQLSLQLILLILISAAVVTYFVRIQITYLRVSGTF